MIWIPLAFTAAIVLMVIAVPFFGRKGVWMRSPPDPVHAELVSRKESLLRAMKDIKFEYENGTLSREDRDVLHADYKREAALVLMRLEKAEGIEQARVRDAAESRVTAEREALDQE
ncbi:MAG: hypothetical protein O7H41_06590 [Planctomycetota bacterium]|nr:hypothetical protein [Planctomycetota bacterium]